MLVSPIYNLDLQVFHRFLLENNFIKYKISHCSPQAHFLSVKYLAAETLHTLTMRYATRVQRMPRLQIIFLTGKSNE